MERLGYADDFERIKKSARFVRETFEGMDARDQQNKRGSNAPSR